MIEIIHICEEYVHNPVLGYGEHKLVEYPTRISEAQLIEMISQCVWDGDRWWFHDDGGSFRVM